MRIDRTLMTANDRQDRGQDSWRFFALASQHVDSSGQAAEKAAILPLLVQRRQRLVHREV